MHLDKIDAAAELLKTARLENRVIDNLPEEFRPANLSEAYAIQDRLADILGWEIGGWFCACTNPAIQTVLGLYEPYRARLFADYIFPEPATLNAAEYPPIVLECEFGFTLGADLAPRSEPYTREEVENAIERVHPCIEVVAGHLMDWPQQDVWSIIADNGTDGALVYGAGTKDWRKLDLTNIPVTLELNGEIVRRGLSKNVLGNPIEALVWLANDRSKAGDGLHAGHIHNTGTATDITWIESGDKAVAHFDGLGDVNLQISHKLAIN